MGDHKGNGQTLKHLISVSDSISCRRVSGPDICHSNGGCRASVPHSMLNGGRLEFWVSHFDCNRLFHPRVAPSCAGYWSYILANGTDLVVSVLWCQNTFTNIQCSCCYEKIPSWFTLRWRHKMASAITSVSIVYQRSKKTSKFRVTGLWEGNSPVTGEFHAQRASNAKNVSIWWRYHELKQGPVVSFIGTISLLTCIRNICQRHYTINWQKLA